MRRLCLFLLCHILAVSCTQGGHRESETRKEVLFPVRADVVKKGPIERALTFVGNIEAIEKSTITPHGSGKVAKLYANAGDRVKKGQILAELDSRHLRLELERARAGLDIARLNMEEARNNFERMKRLFEEAAVTAQQFEKAKFAFETATAQLHAAEAAVRLLEHELDLTVMRAPFDGIVAKRLVEEGDFVNPAMGGVVFILLDTSRVKLELDVSEQDLPFIRKGQRAILTLPSAPGRSFEGVITRINHVADPVSKTFKVRTEFENHAGELKTGLFAEVRVIVEARAETLLVRKEALIGDTIFVVDNGVARRRKVKKGIEGPTLVEVKEGLREGEVYIFEGAIGLKEGSRVKVIE